MATERSESVLHVIVGHGLPVMYLNTVASVRSILETAALVVVDNDSPQHDLKDQLRSLEENDPHLRVVFRSSNEMANGKVGGLYAAYDIAFRIARDEGFDYVHLMQADMQLLRWDEEVMSEAIAAFDRHPRCVNVFTVALSSDRVLTGDVELENESGDYVLSRYGLTDTGLYSMERWATLDLSFGPTEEEHAARAAALGCEVVVLRQPTEVQIPWPAVVRFGKQRGREVISRRPFLCRPLSTDELHAMKRRPGLVTMEELCVPWGWSCLSPMWNTDMKKLDYLVLRRRAVVVRGVREGLPRWDTRGLSGFREIVTSSHRPSLIALAVQPLPELMKLLRERLLSRR